MIERNKAVIDGAVVIARETGADAILLAASLQEEAEYLRQLVGAERRVIVAGDPADAPLNVPDGELLRLPEVRMRRRGRAKVALLEGLASGFLVPGQRVVVLSGSTVNEESTLDTVAVIDLWHDGDPTDPADSALTLLREAADAAVFDSILRLCVELGHDGKEGKP
ncbi:MAG: hypothetical protein ACRELX_17380, partial [Longimicrobiales bacterium]